jgi:hypothetical protein
MSATTIVTTLKRPSVSMSSGPTTASPKVNKNKNLHLQPPTFYGCGKFQVSCKELSLQDRVVATTLTYFFSFLVLMTVAQCI